MRQILLLDPLVVAIFCIFFISSYFRQQMRKLSARLPLPPGPRKLPFIGNMLDIPPVHDWEQYHKWCTELGTDIIHLTVAGRSIVIIDTHEAASYLLEKKSAIYSSRPAFTMANELMGWDFSFAFKQYGERWRAQRKLMHASFHQGSAPQFRPQELKAARGLLRRFLSGSGTDVVGSLRKLSGETIMSITYGIDTREIDDPYIKMAEAGVVPLLEAIRPGAFLVDFFPGLKYIPEWVPGAGFKRKARIWRKSAEGMINFPFETTKRNIENGRARLSFVSMSMQKQSLWDETPTLEEDTKATAGAIYQAGSDTTVSALSTAILALLENPHILRKAQEEIDSALRPGQLPDFDDISSLPYITAITKETLRWRPVTPLGVPHYVGVDDDYNGYRIPAGSTIIPNTWAMLKDEAVYPDTETFIPERFLTGGESQKNAEKLLEATWGFGRRICPGRHMAFSSIWITIASLVAAFDITKKRDELGNIIPLPTPQDYSTSIVSLPTTFQCSFKPRSHEMERSIMATALEEYVPPFSGNPS